MVFVLSNFCITVADANIMVEMAFLTGCQRQSNPPLSGMGRSG